MTRPIWCCASAIDSLKVLFASDVTSISILFPRTPDNSGGVFISASSRGRKLKAANLPLIFAVHFVPSPVNFIPSYLTTWLCPESLYKKTLNEVPIMIRTMNSINTQFFFDPASFIGTANKCAYLNVIVDTHIPENLNSLYRYRYIETDIYDVRLPKAHSNENAGKQRAV